MPLKYVLDTKLIYKNKKAAKQTDSKQIIIFTLFCDGRLLRPATVSGGPIGVS